EGERRVESGRVVLAGEGTAAGTAGTAAAVASRRAKPMSDEVAVRFMGTSRQGWRTFLGRGVYRSARAGGVEKQPALAQPFERRLIAGRDARAALPAALRPGSRGVADPLVGDLARARFSGASAARSGFITAAARARFTGASARPAGMVAAPPR